MGDSFCHVMGREGCFGHETPRAKSSWLALGPTQTPREPIEKHLIPSLVTDVPEQQKILVCFVMTESFPGFAGLR